MNIQDRLVFMLEQTAEALGDSILETSAFVGGCVVGLLVTDSFTREQVRATDDVDLIVDVLNFAEYRQLASTLRARGFKESMLDNITCRWRLGEIIVDVMPTDEKILGFTNVWYQSAIASAQPHQLPSGKTIRLVSAPYFIATKMEAFKGRGENDFLTSRDIEDIITIIDGREELAQEIAEAEPDLRMYVSTGLRSYLGQKDFEYAIESAVRSDRARVDVIHERLMDLMID